MKRKIMTIMLCLALVFTMMPTLGGFSYAAEIIGVSSVSEDGIVTWQMEEGSTQVRVGLYSYTTELGQAYVGTDNSFDIFQWLTEKKVESGRYQARIEYYNELGEYKVIISDYFDYVSPLTKLATPTNLRFDGKVARWDAVEGASSYSLVLTNTSGYLDRMATSYTNYYDCKNLLVEGTHEYKFTVQAIGNENYIDSDVGESELTIVDNEKPSLQNVTISDEGIMSWDPFDQATKYIVLVGPNREEVTEPSIDLIQACADHNVAAGYPTIEIWAEKGGNQISKKYANNTWEYKGKLRHPTTISYEPYPHAICWDRVAEAEKYRVIIYPNDEFQPPVLDEIVTTTRVGVSHIEKFGLNRFVIEIVAMAKGYAPSNSAIFGPLEYRIECDGEHTYGEWHEKTAADCTHAAVEIRECTLCGVTNTRSEGDPLGHQFDNYVYNNDETCTEDGTETATCERAGCSVQDTRTKEGTMVDHTYGTVKGFDDNYHWLVCTECGEIGSKEAHDILGPYTAVMPTCTEKGLERTECKKCDYEAERDYNPLGHIFTNYVYDNNATCTADGTETAICSRDGCVAEKTRTKSGTKLDHTPGEYVTNETTHSHVCVDCGEVLTIENHQFGPCVVTKEATCLETGSRERTCSVCGYKAEEIIPLANHRFTNYIFNSDATCTEDGTKTATCDVEGCDAVDTKAAAGTATGHHSEEELRQGPGGHYKVCDACRKPFEVQAHTYGDYTTTKEPTCEEVGTKERRCTVCDYAQTATIDPLDHQFGEYTYNNDATCNADGTETAHCQREGCDKTDTRTKTGTKLQHAFNTYVADGNATCISRGTETAHCDNAGCEANNTRNVTTGAFGEHQSGDTFAHNETSHWHTCVLCGERISSTVTAHNYGEEIIDTAAGCEAPGAKHRICQDCGYREDSVINPLGHETVKHDAVESTCTVAGNEEYYSCTRCDKYFANAAATTEIEEGSWTLELEPHDYVLHEAVEIPCDKDRDGREEHLCCSVCHHTAVYDEHGHIVETDKFHTDFLIQGGHDIIEKQRVEPTCTTDGNEHHFYCTRCHKAFMDEGLIMEYDAEAAIIPKLGHRFENYVEDNNATCYNDGTKTAHCENPGCSEVDTKTVEDTALGHDFSLTQKKTDATCESNEIWERECSRCHKKQEFEEPNTKLGHNGQFVEWVASTCTTQGHSGYYDCVRCDKYFKDAAYTIEIEEGSWVLPFADHNNVHYDGKAATCLEAGYKAYDVCSTCGHSTYEAIDALGHETVHHDGKAATCTEAGWEAYDTCSRCDYTTKVEIPALGHQKVHHDGKAATCTDAGWEAYDDCSRCDYTTKVEKPALGHSNVHHDAKAPTCTEAGWDAYDACSRCDYTTKVEKPKTDHVASDWIVNPATMSTSGEKHIECVNCHELLDVQYYTQIKSVFLSATKYVYNGKVKKPTVTVTDGSGARLVEGKDYTVTYATGRKLAGKYKVTVKFMGDYSGTKALYFTINPAVPAIKSLTPGTKSLKVTATAKPSTKGAATYQIAYRVKGTTTWKYVTTTTATKTIKSLKKGKVYQVRIRAYKTVNQVKYYSNWSAIKVTKKIK